MWRSILYLYHKLMKHYHKRQGEDWQTAAFERHHHAMKYHKSKL